MAHFLSYFSMLCCIFFNLFLKRCLLQMACWLYLINYRNSQVAPPRGHQECLQWPKDAHAILGWTRTRIAQWTGPLFIEEKCWQTPWSAFCPLFCLIPLTKQRNLSVCHMRQSAAVSKHVWRRNTAKLHVKGNFFFNYKQSHRGTHTTFLFFCLICLHFGCLNPPKTAISVS